MKYQHIKTSILEQFKAPRGNDVVPFILGAPGGGKSACAREVISALEIPQSNVVEFTASLRDPVDIMGTPNNEGDYTRWVPPQEFYQLRQGVGRSALILEELSDATVPVQNALCGVIYDRRAGGLQLSDELFIIATGNRTEDKSGANRLTSKLVGRARVFDFTENMDDWTLWALDNDVDPVLIQFLRFRPSLLAAFDPNQRVSPTPRNWERVSRIPSTMPDSLMFETIAGDVGEGAAAEYLGFRKIYNSLPDVDSILLAPDHADVPTDPATLYALTGALAKKATANNFDRVSSYLKRLAPEFSVMCTKDSITYQPAIRKTRSFIEWATANADVLM